jgi:tetratricopeptide (TPR) repeat protein
VPGKKIMNLKKTILLFCLAGIAILGKSQNKIIDSLKTIVTKTTNDTIKINALFAWDNLIYFEDHEMDYTLNKQIEATCKKHLSFEKNKKLIFFYANAIGKAYNNIGITYSDKGNLEQALYYYFQSLRVRKKLNDQKNIAGSLNNIGDIYNQQGNNARALEYYTSALSIREKINDQRGVANSLGSIAIIFAQQNDHAKALSYFEKALLVNLKINETEGIASCYNNIGNVYRNMLDFKKARAYFKKALEIRRKMHDPMGMAAGFNNTGDIDMKEGKYEDALLNYDSAYLLSNAIHDETGISNAWINTGNVYYKIGNLKKAAAITKKGMVLAQKTGNVSELQAGSGILYVIFRAQGKTKEALEMKKMHVRMNDSLTSLESARELIRHEFRYAYEKKALADSVRVSEEKILAKEQLASERTQKYGLFGGLFLILIFGAVIANRSIKTQNQKKIIEEQKKLVEKQKEIAEKKQKELLDSIHYAKRIQMAILPNEHYISRKIGKCS